MSAPRCNPVSVAVATAAPLLIATTWPEAAAYCERRHLALVAVDVAAGQVYLITGLHDWMSLHGLYTELRAVPRTLIPPADEEAPPCVP